MHLNDAFSSIIPFPWLVFSHGYSFFYLILPHPVYFLMWFSVISLMMRLALLLVVPEDLCVYVLVCTILLVQHNKSLVSSPRPLRACMVSITWYSKICAFGVTLNPSLWRVSMETATKTPFSLVLSRFGSTFCNNYKAP